MKKINQKPLTLDQLVEYSRTVLFPAMDERFSSKKEFSEFKDKMYTNIDGLFKKLDILLDEKEVREYQEIKHKKLWAIMIKALREHQILSSKELEEINGLEIF